MEYRHDPHVLYKMKLEKNQKSNKSYACTEWKANICINVSRVRKETARLGCGCH